MLNPIATLGRSCGEQQRIGFARVLLYRPDWLFMDEAMSALDKNPEQALYGLVRERFSRITMIPVAHRATVATFHRWRLTLCPQTRRIEDGLEPAEAVISPRDDAKGATQLV